MQNTGGPTEGGFRAGIETGPDGESTGNIICYPSFNPNCKVVTLPKSGNYSAGFLSLPEPKRFHDEVLTNATAEINQILSKVLRETSRDSRRSSLHVVLLDEGPMLVWADSEVMETNDIRKGSSKAHAAVW